MKKLVIRIIGVDCPTCVYSIERRLKSVRGFAELRVDVSTGLAEVICSEDCSAREVYEAIREAGYDVYKDTVEVYLDVSPEQMSIVEKRISGISGVLEARVSPSTGLARISFNPLETTRDQLYQELSRIGVKTRRAPRTRLIHSEKFNLATRLTAFAVALGVISYSMAGMLSPSIMLDEWVVGSAAFLVLVLSSSFIKRGFKALLMRAPTMESLVALSSTISFTAGLILSLGFPELDHQVHGLVHTSSFYEASAGVLGFVSMGKYLEERLKQKAFKYLEELEKASEGKARVFRGDSVAEVDVSQVHVNDIVEARSGDRIPVDGVVVEGSAYVDESLLTGESRPVLKKAENRDYVLAGSTVLSGYLRIRVTRVGRDTTVARIAEEAGRAQFYKPGIQRLADRVVGFITWVVIAVAFVVATTWYMLTGNPLLSVLTAVAVLAVTCPCPLGIAIPMAVSIGVVKASRKGILVRRGDVFERITRSNTVIFDKTGTLTTGEPRVTRVIKRGKYDERTVMSYACSIEARSEHRLAQAIVEYCRENNYAFHERVEDFNYFPGLGVVGRVNGHLVAVGSIELATRLGLSIDEETGRMVSTIGSNAKTPVLVIVDDELAAVVEISDTLRPEARFVVKRLKELGFRVGVASGDVESAVQRIREDLELDLAVGELKPMDKAELVRETQMKGGKVVFIGDGVNDAPALGAAFVGVAMGKATDIAKNAGDVVLVSNDLRGLLEIYKLSRRVNRIALENLAWAFVYNAVLIPIAAGALYPSYGVLLKPEWAALAMILSDISVVANSLRLIAGKSS
ncbi:MAG: heavy metal translocating P-type ATPase [Desulfurococcaceae archaeon]